VVTGATDWLARNGNPDLTAVAIAPDLGERYLDTIYQTNWVHDLYGDSVLDEGMEENVGGGMNGRLDHGLGSDEMPARSA
jgi:hypothetical protein